MSNWQFAERNQFSRDSKGSTHCVNYGPTKLNGSFATALNGIRILPSIFKGKEKKAKFSFNSFGLRFFNDV